MKNNTAIPKDQPEARCSSPDWVYIQGSYTDSGNAVNDASYVDPEAEIQRQVKRQLEILDHQVADMSADPTKPRKGRGPTVFIGYDTEFVSGESGDDNTILSLQFYLVGEGGSFQHIVYPTGITKAERPRIDKVLAQLIIDAMQAGVIYEWPSMVVLCGFFLRLDLQAFSDLTTFKNKLDNVGGKVASVTRRSCAAFSRR